MDRDKILSKIKKCMALSKSANAHEAAAALRQAQKLMAEHGVSESELSMLDVAERRAKAQSGVARWEIALSHMVAEAFGCKRFRDSYQPNWRSAHKYEYVFVGLCNAPQIAAYTFSVLSRQCAKARLAYVRAQPKNCKPTTRTARGDEFARAWVYAVRETVEKFAQPEASKQLLLAYMSAKHPDLEARPAKALAKTGTKQDVRHALAGFVAGKEATLNRGVGGIQTQELLA